MQFLRVAREFRGGHAPCISSDPMGPKASELETVERLRRDEAALDAQLANVRAEARQVVARGSAESARVLEEAQRALEHELASLREADAGRIDAELAAGQRAARERRESLAARAAHRRERAIELVIARVMP